MRPRAVVKAIDNGQSSGMIDVRGDVLLLSTDLVTWGRRTFVRRRLTTTYSERIWSGLGIVLGTMADQPRSSGGLGNNHGYGTIAISHHFGRDE
jgi:hypothetical protein